MAAVLLQLSKPQASSSHVSRCSGRPAQILIALVWFFSQQRSEFLMELWMLVHLSDLSGAFPSKSCMLLQNKAENTGRHRGPGSDTWPNLRPGGHMRPKFSLAWASLANAKRLARPLQRWPRGVGGGGCWSGICTRQPLSMLADNDVLLGRKGHWWWWWRGVGVGTQGGLSVTPLLPWQPRNPSPVSIRATRALICSRSLSSPQAASAAARRRRGEVELKRWWVSTSRRVTGTEEAEGI